MAKVILLHLAFVYSRNPAPMSVTTAAHYESSLTAHTLQRTSYLSVRLTLDSQLYLCCQVGKTVLLLDVTIPS